MSDMKIKMVKLSDIKPYFNNPRNNQAAIDPVAESLSRYGFTKPIIVDKDGVIIAGHTRYFACVKLGVDKVPVVYSDMDEHKAQMFRIIDNKSAERSYHDENKLLAELQEMDVEHVQPFFFEDLFEKIADSEAQGDGSFPYGGGMSDGSDYDPYNSDTDNDYSPSESREDDTDEDNKSEALEEQGTNLIESQELFKVRVVNGVKKMWVCCPYCKHKEEITL